MLKIGKQHKIDIALCFLAPYQFIVVLSSFPANLTANVPFDLPGDLGLE